MAWLRALSLSHCPKRKGGGGGGGAKLTKSAQGGPHLDIKQDLISESDLMR